MGVRRSRVKGGGKVDHVGGLIAGLWLSTFRENVRLSVQLECHLSIPGMVSDGRVAGVARDRRVGGLPASMYLLTVSLWMPNSLAIPQMDRPLSLARYTAFQRSFCRNVGFRGDAVTCSSATTIS